jgi:CubicO group peptidase (beta-lactamase class C family)
MAQTKILSAVTLLAFTSLASWAAEPEPIPRLDGSTIRPTEIDSTVTRLMRNAEVPGVGIAIFNHGKITYLKAYGFRDKEHGLPLTADSVMTGASLTKTAFAYLAMKLVNERRLDLDKACRAVFSQTAHRISPLLRSGRRSALQANHRENVAQPHRRLSELPRSEPGPQAEYQL